MNPIKYSDLIQPDGSVSSLVKGLKDAEAAYTKLINAAKSNADALRNALQGANPGTSAGQAQITAMAQQIDDLNKKVADLTAKLAQNRQKQKQAAATDRDAIRAKEELRMAVKQVTNEVKAEIATDRLSEDEMKRLSQMSEIQKMSYNELARAYGLLKAQINEMTGATETEIAARQKASAVARNVYEQMNTLQQATGRYQLQVGNYQKSWNGLNIAMQQIVREVPNVKMGFDMFFLAISNNIPILSDQIKLAKERYAADKAQLAQMKAMGASAAQLAAQEAKLVPVGKQILSSLFSWQTALIAGVTLLTLYGGKIVEWFKKLVKGTNEAEEALKRYNENLSKMATAGGEEVGLLRLLYAEVTDVNEAMNDRKDAMESLLRLYPKTFSNFSQEEIMAGRAAEAYEQLAKSLIKAAMAQSAQQKAAEIGGKLLEAEMRKMQAEQAAIQAGYKSITEAMAKEDAALALAEQRTSIDFTGEGDIGAGLLAFWSSGRERKVTKPYREAVADIEKYTKEMKSLQQVIDDFDLWGLFEEKGGGGGKETKIADYFWDAIEEFMNGLNEGLPKELADLTVKFLKAKDTIKKNEDELLEIIKTGTKEQAAEAKTQMGYLSVQLAALTSNFEIEKNNLIKKTLASYVEEVDDEPDYEEQVRNSIKTRLDVEKELRDAGIYQMYEAGNIDGDDLKAMLGDSTTEYWQAMLDDFRKNGVLTVEEYNKIMEKLVKEQDEDVPWWAKILGLDAKQVRNIMPFLRSLNQVFNKTIDSINDVIDAYKEEAEAARDAAQEQVDAAQTVYEAELDAYKNGYANNVEYARKELETQKEKLAETNKQVAKYSRIQRQMNALEQASSLALASANLFANASKLGAIGIPVAVAATATMFAAFTAAQIKANQLAKKGITTYGEGMHEYLNYGGSHASGHDIDFGRDRNGRQRRVERGEMIAVFNARNTRRYGAGTLGDLVDAVNHGALETMYSQAFAGAGGLNVSVDADSPYARGMAEDISAIRRNGERRYVMGNGTVIEKYRNRTRIKHIS